MPASKRRSRGLPAFVWIIGVLIAALVATLIRSCDDTENPGAEKTPSVEKAINKPIGNHGLKPEDVTVTGAKVPTGISATKSAATPYPAPDKLTNALTPVYEIGPSGRLQAPMTITFHFDRKVGTDNTVVVMTNAAHTKEAWVPVAATLSNDRQSASIIVDHLSWFQALEDLVGNTADTFMGEMRRSFDDLMGGATAEASKPKCENEKQARANGYTIDSSSKATLYWCFGMQDGKRVLKVVNRMRYPLDIRHPGLTPLKLPQHLELASLAALTAGKSIILFPFDEATFVVDMGQGGSGVLRTSHSGMAQSLYQLQVGVTAALDILTRFGAGGGTIANGAYTVSKFDRVIEKVDKLLGVPECASAIENFTPGKLLTKCFSPELVLRVFGTWAVFVAPAMVVGPLVEFFRSELNTLGDQLNGRSKYGIVIQRGKTLKFYNLTIPLRSSWTVKFKSVERYVDQAIVSTGNRCITHSGGSQDCAEFSIHGPTSSMGVVSDGKPYDPSGMWNTHGDIGGCYMYADHLHTGPDELKLNTTAKIGSRTVEYREWKVGCTSQKNFESGLTEATTSYAQRVWYDPRSKIFIVDEWNTPGLPEALARATWS